MYWVYGEPLGLNRFTPAIQRGAVTFRCNVAFDGLGDAKHFCQSDHESIFDIQADAREGMVPRGELEAAEQHVAILRKQIESMVPAVELRPLFDALSLALDKWGDLRAGTRGPVSHYLKNPANERRVFDMVIALNNLAKQWERLETLLGEKGGQ